MELKKKNRKKGRRNDSPLFASRHRSAADTHHFFPLLPAASAAPSSSTPAGWAPSLGMRPTLSRWRGPAGLLVILLIRGHGSLLGVLLFHCDKLYLP